MQVKGCSKRNRWHLFEGIATVWNGKLEITCLCILSFLPKDFSQTGQNQFESTPQEQNVDWEKGRMLCIYICFQAIRFYRFPPPHHHLLISIVFLPPPPARAPLFWTHNRFYMNQSGGYGVGKYWQEYCSYCLRETLIRYGGGQLLCMEEDS